MNLKYLGLLYLRNIKGMFFHGIVTLADKYPPLVSITWTIFFALLPISLTLGAGVKTLFDFFTRKAIPIDTINIRKEEINAMDEEQITALTDKMFDYEHNAKSNSSKRLLDETDLWELKAKHMYKHRPLKIEGELSETIGSNNHRHAVKKDRLAVEQLGEDAINYSQHYISKLELNSIQQSRLDQYDEEIRHQLLQRQKELITTYMSDEKNNGKKLLQIICGFFAAPVLIPKVTTTTHDNEDEQQETCNI